MDLGPLDSEPGIAGAVSIALALWGLISRFSNRRLASSPSSIALAGSIVLLSGAAAFLVAALTVGKVGVIGVATGVPFWAARPGTGGALNTQAPTTRVGASQVLAAVWAVTGFLTTRLDSKLSTNKWKAIETHLSNIAAADTGSYPPDQRVANMLRQHAEGLTDEDEQSRRITRISVVEDASEDPAARLRGLLGLVYDWKLDDLLTGVVASPLST